MVKTDYHYFGNPVSQVGKSKYIMIGDLVISDNKR